MNPGGVVAQDIYLVAAMVAIITALLALARWGAMRFRDDIIRRIGTPPEADIATMNVSQLDLLAQIVAGQSSTAEKVADHEVRIGTLESGHAELRRDIDALRDR